MQMPTRGRIEWNLNTLVSLAGFVGVIVSIGVAWGNATSSLGRIEEKFDREIQRIDIRSDSRRAESEQRWRDHDALHRERATENAALAARNDERFRVIETEVRKIENLQYRMTVLEQGTATLATSVEELKNAVNEQRTDTRIIKQILEQMREAQGLPTRSPGGARP